MPITIEQIGDWVLADDNWTCKFGWADARGQVQGQPVLTPRAGTSPALQQGQISARTMPVRFIYSGASLVQGFQTLAGKLGIDDATPRRIIGTEFDGARVQTTAAVALTSGWDDSRSMNLVLGSLVAGKTRWEATTTTTVSATLTDVGQYPAIAIPNAGFAAVEPVITITPTLTAHLSTSSTVGWQYRRQVTVTNNGANTLTNWPLQINLGSTTAWVTDGALSSGNDLRVLLNGVELPRTLVAWNYGQTFCWILAPSISPGETVTLDFVYGNPSAGSPAVLTGKLHPSIIYEYDKGAATASSTTTRLNDTSKAWNVADVNFVGGWVWMTSGVNIGLRREVTFQGTNFVLTAAFPSAIGTGDTYLIYHSDNGRFWYNTNQWFDASSVTPVHGRWYSNKRANQPTDIDFDVAASWRPYAMYDNQDRFAQTSITHIGGNYFSVLNAFRSWQGGGSKGQLTSEDGIADGVALRSPVPILSYHSVVEVENNLNGMAQAVVMARADGAEGFSIQPAGTLTANGTQTVDVTLPVDSPYYQLYQGLIPSDNEGVIRPDRARDSGSTSADGATRTVVTNATTPLGGWYLRKDPDSASAHVQDSTPADIVVTNSIPVELDGRKSGSWRGVIYNDGANEYKGWLPVAFLSGTSTGGDTLVDGSKNWVTNELTGAQIKVTGSPNKDLVGKTHTVTGNTATTITVGTAFGATVVQGTAYEIAQPPTTVTLVDGPYCWVNFDTSVLAISAPSAKQNVYQVAAQLLVGDGGPATFIRRVETRIGLDALVSGDPPVRVFLQTTESLVLDGPNRRASVVDASGNVLRTLTDPAVLVQQVAQDVINRRKVTKRAARWLPMAMGIASTADFEHNTAISQKNANWTVTALSNDTTAGIYDVVFAVTANTGGTDSTADLLFTIPFAVALGQRLQYVASVRTTNVNLQPRLGVNWYSDALGTALISSTYQPQWTPAAANVWYESGFSAINADLSDARINPYDADAPLYFAPNNVLSAKLVVRVVSKSGSQTGTVRVGVRTGAGGPRMGMPILWYREVGGNGLTITTAFPAGYLG